jgi:CRP-like cAMP-binding protein
MEIVIEQHRLLRTYIEKLIPDIEEDTWQQFAERLTVRNYKKGELAVKPGMVCNNVSYVNKGLLRSYYLVDGKEIITSFFPEACYFSDYESFLSRKPAVMYSEAIEDTEVVDLNYDDLQSLYASYPQCERVGRLVAEELFVHLSNRNSSFMLDTPEQRYARFLQECEPIVQRIPQYMIASYLGITPEALSRIRARISRKPAGSLLIDPSQLKTKNC